MCIRDRSLAVLDAVAGVVVDASYRPMVLTKIDTIRVDTHGYTFSFLTVDEEEAAPSPAPEET